jgi:diaminopimelate decarboxylase
MISYKNGFLLVDGVNIADVAVKTGTPCYLYSSKKLIENFRVFDDAFSSTKHIVCYAVKANASPYLLKALAKNGCGCDMVSLGELKLALMAGVPPQKIVFAGVGKRPDEIKEALLAGILMFNVESLPELFTIDRVAKSLGKHARIAFRINPDIDAKTHHHITTGLSHNKFGLCFDEALEGYKLAQGLGNIEIAGVHCHIGSQITELSAFELAAKKVSDFVEKLGAAGIRLKYIDMGGGLGVKYKDEQVISPRSYAEAMIKRLPKGHTLILEPGRFMVAETGLLVTRVIYVKKTSRKNFVIVDAGMNDLVRPAIYDAYHEIIPALKREGTAHNCDVVGPICESSDCFAKDRKMSPVEEGDFVAILTAGAYGYSMSSNYNMRPRPAEAVIEGGKWKIIRSRETIEDILK